MATGDLVVTSGSYTSLIASEAENDGAFCTISGTIASVLAATVEDYPLLDFKLDVTAGTFAADDTVDLYRVPGDGTDQAPTPTSSYLQQYVGSFVLSGSADEYYLYGVNNPDNNDKFIWVPNVTTNITAQLFVRGRSLNAAA
jgi:hypothetical protein